MTGSQYGQYCRIHSQESVPFERICTDYLLTGDTVDGIRLLNMMRIQCKARHTSKTDSGKLGTLRRVVKVAEPPCAVPLHCLQC